MPQDEIERLAIATCASGVARRAPQGRRSVYLRTRRRRGASVAAAGVPFEIVPGVSSAYAVPAYAGIPVTHREYAASFTVATGHEDPGKAVRALDWAKLADPAAHARAVDGNRKLGEIAKRLIAHGLAPQTPVAVVQDGTRPSQRTVLGRLDSIAGDVAAARDRRSGRRRRWRRRGAADAAALVRHRRALRQARLDHASRRTVESSSHARCSRGARNRSLRRRLPSRRSTTRALPIARSRISHRMPG